MVNPDILRIMSELHTFTAEDLAEALDCPVGTVGGLLPQWVRRGYLERLKSGRTFIYTLSGNSERQLQRLKPIDPDERCLMLVKLATTDRYLYYRDTPVLDTSEDEISWLIQS